MLSADPSGTARRQRGQGAAAARLAGWLRDYRSVEGIPDELFDRNGEPRRYWLDFLGDFAEYREDEFKSRFALATRHIRDTGVTYRIYGEENETSWPLNPLPLILGEAEWAQIAAGVEQRANLMEALLQDIYGDATLIRDGALPAAALTGSTDFLRALRGVKPPGGRYLQIYAADLGRGPDGRWWVVGDRTQAPSGAGYALENRLILSRTYPNLYNRMNVQRLAPFFEDLRHGLAAAADRVEPRICLLTPGPFSETYFEQAHLARYLGFLLVEGGDLIVRDGKVYVRTISGLKRADVILRRVDADFIDPLELNGASQLGTPGLLDAIRKGGVAVLNMPGSGVLESKALLGFLPALCQRLLGEPLKMPNVATWWGGQPEGRAHVEANLANLAVSPAFGATGSAVPFSQPVLMADLSPADQAWMRSQLADRPFDYVGQEVVRLSTTPVWRDGGLAAAPFVMRVYAAATPDGMRIMPGGFCRTSDRSDVRAISMGQGARTADVWVIADAPVERTPLIAPEENVTVRRITGLLPSRAAENLFWLGRYLERAEATLRLIRSLCTSLMDAEAASHTTGETLVRLQQLLISWGALDKSAAGGRALDNARAALHDAEARGSVIQLVRMARRAGSSMRERLSADFWTLLVNLEARLVEGSGEGGSGEDGSGEDGGGEDGGGGVQSEIDALEQVEVALRLIAALSGLAQENMNRVAGWRFLDMGRRIERGINICRFTQALVRSGGSSDDLDLLLDLADSQITYRARYLVGLATKPVTDMVMLDPFNTRSLAFQLVTLKAHLALLPLLVDDGILEAPNRMLLKLASEVETSEAGGLDGERIQRFETTLMQLSDAVGERYFQQGANAGPTIKLSGLA